MGLGGVISNLLSLGAKLLPAVIASPSSSSSLPVDQNHQIEAELQKLMRMLERIKATLYDAEQREITDSSVKLWLKELKGVAHDAEDVLGEYHYEVLRAQVEARDASPPDSRKRKLIQVPYGMLDQIQQIRSKFDEITKDRIALQLSEGDGPRRCNNELQIAPTSHFVVESNIFGREGEKEKLIDLLSSECDVVSVVTIVGMGGIGKTTLAQLAYNDQRIRQKFDKFGWICVSEDFNVERLTKESVESITRNECGLTNLSALQEKIREEISGKRVLLVLDDVWNEKKSFWDLFQTPFMSATFAKILVTTRNDHVARIMQTEPTFNLSCLSAEQCWQLFEHYAFGGVDQNKSPKLVEIGKQIMKKCGMLPLAVKSVGSLLRHEADEESWREILESELWESEDVSIEIFPTLQISYARLPTYLKSCFLYCSVFPKDCTFDVGKIVRLWMSQGFVESRGNKTAENIGFEYAQQLCQRSLFEREDRYRRNEFKLHDIVHDLARRNSENSCFSIEVGKVPIFPKVLHHLHIDNYVNLGDPIPSDKFSALRTLITGLSANDFFSTFDLSMAPKLRALDTGKDSELLSLSSVGNLKHLRYLSLYSLSFGKLPECICSLYNLQYLTLIGIHDLKELPTKIGNLISLEELKIEDCSGFRVLPGSLCQLKALRKLCLIQCQLLEELPSDMGSLINLQTLEINNTGVSCLPPSLGKILGNQAQKVELICETIGWLKDFPNLEGTLCLRGLKNIPNLMDVQCANLTSMRNLEQLILDKDDYGYWDKDDSTTVLELTIKSGQNIFLEDQSCFSVMVSLQPHPNLRKLEILDYGGITFPEWIGSLCKLKYLKIARCSSLQFLKAESLPLELEQLDIFLCRQLVSMPGIQKLKSLIKLSIGCCENLCSFMEPSLELTMRAGVGPYESSLLGMTNLASLRSLQISDCLKLQVSADELLPAKPCKVEVFHCPGLREWCLQHGINYEVTELRCGGVVVGCMFDHRVVDAYSINMFMSVWANIALGQPINQIPSFSTSFPFHSNPLDPLLDRLYTPISLHSPLNPSTSLTALISRIYYIRAVDIARLQEIVGHRYSKIICFTAYLWQMLAKSACQGEKSCSMGLIVNGRTRMKNVCGKNMMENYFGNVISAPFGNLRGETLLDMKLAEVTDEVHKWLSPALTEDHFLGLLDWIEAHRPEPITGRIYLGDSKEEEKSVSCLVSSGRGFPEINFGWGKAVFGSYHFPWGGNAGYVMPIPQPNTGDWVVYAHVAPSIVAVMEAEPTIFHRLTTEYFLCVDKSA